MRLSVSAGFTLKDRPKGYLGLCREHYNFGKDKYISLSSLVLVFLKVVIGYYMMFEKAETLNAETKKIYEAIGELHFREKD
jgi:hypothetical protein